MADDPNRSPSDQGQNSDPWLAALQTWSSDQPVSIQRARILQARACASCTEIIRQCDWLLTALSDPADARQECEQGQAGTPLVQQQAAERLALLEKNPNLSAEKADLKDSIVAVLPQLLDTSLQASR